MKSPLPGYQNLYIIVQTERSKQEIAEDFQTANWKLRKSSWEDFELSCDWAELNLEGESEVLLNGTIAPNQLANLQSLLDDFRLDYSLELYDEKKQLLQQRSSFSKKS